MTAAFSKNTDVPSMGMWMQPVLLWRDGLIRKRQEVYLFMEYLKYIEFFGLLFLLWDVGKNYACV